MAPSNEFGLVPRIVNGGIAGLVGVTCVFPIDLVKTRLQNQQIGPNGERMYKSMLDCGIKTFKREGFFGMYRGSGVNLLLITPEKVIKLVGNDIFRHLLHTKDSALTYTRECLAGAGAGFSQIIITTPMELLKIQLQDAGRSAASKAATDTSGASNAAAVAQVVKKQQRNFSKEVKPVRLSATKIALELVKEKGIFGLYKGFASTGLRDVTFSAIYFPLFANLNKVGKRWRGTDQEMFYISFTSGCIAGATASFSVTPFDCIKTRLQTLKKGSGERHYSGVIDAFQQTYKYEGWRAFFKGGACRVMVIAPLFGIAQMMYFLGVAEWLLGYKKQSQIN